MKRIQSEANVAKDCVAKLMDENHCLKARNGQLEDAYRALKAAAQKNCLISSKDTGNIDLWSEGVVRSAKEQPLQVQMLYSERDSLRE